MILGRARTALLAIAALLVLGLAPADAAPRAQKPRTASKARATTRTAKPPPKAGKTAAKLGKPTKPTRPARSRDPKHAQKLGAHARVAFGGSGELRAAADPVGAGRRVDAVTPEEEAAAEIEKLLRGPLRSGVTGLYVADARTGAPLFAVNADDPLNPASNVKLISTAAALELLGPDFRYPTRLLGPTPVRGAIHGDLFLLGSHDPTLTRGHLDELAAQLAARGVTSIEGGVAVGTDPTRDGLFRAIIPIEISAGEPGKPATASAPPGFDFVTVKVTAVTGRKARSKLTYKEEVSTTSAGAPRITLTIGGTIGKGVTTTYPLWTKQRTATAAYSLIAALRARGIAVAGELAVKELGDFVGEAVSAGALPIELARHESEPVADIVAKINKRSINWLADRLIMTAAGLVARKPPSMELALEAMYAWLSRNPGVARSGVVLDTGSGLSYRTQISSHELVSVVRSAAGFTAAPGEDRRVADAWLRSLAVAGADGTLAHRFRGTSSAGNIFGKTGTLSTVIALSGVLAVDPQRPLAFALVTNTDAPLSKPWVRRAHERVIGEICKYLAKTAARALPALPPPPPPPAPVPAPAPGAGPGPAAPPPANPPTTTPPPGPPPPAVPALAPAHDPGPSSAPEPDDDPDSPDDERAPEPSPTAPSDDYSYDPRLDAETLAPP